MSNIRLFISAKIMVEGKIQLDKTNVHYLLNVMNIKQKERIRIFNKYDGEWISSVDIVSKENVILSPLQKVNQIIEESKIILAFSLLKRLNNNLVVQKATELNVREIYPIVTERTVVRNTKIEKLKLVAKESAEQCGRLDIPKIHNILSINKIIKEIMYKNVILCDNKENSEYIFKLQNRLDYEKDTVILVGPEGGFSKNDITDLNSSLNIFNLSLGGLTLRAETASITSLFAVQMMYSLNK